ncbi:MAG: aminoacyl-tRNA hydrolase [Chlorobi bacterium]|nr:aminoacyl-tRNA hydrolase [Chlorobiota bacterium]MCI0716357.1 aminoacyl-tRNA hydrolase [Chlorobiota bacterium]
MKIDYCIVGLGNPGSRYHNTRHNIGFIVIDKLAEFFKIKSFEFENNYLYSKCVYNEKQIVLMKPLTYMNESGIAVKDFYGKNEVKLENLLIIYDDVNLDFGVIRLRPSGSDGGQNGIKSLIYEMQTEEIPRLRIGIKNESELEKFKTLEGYDLMDYVLSSFTDNEFKQLDKVINESKNALFCFITEGIEAAMNKYNKNVFSEK